MANYKLMPNEMVIKQSDSVAHGGVMAGYTGELVLTNFNLIYVSKGVFGGVKDVLYYPLMQMQKVNGKPNAMVGTLSNGNACVEIFMLNGASETFHFQSIGKRAAKQWVETIVSVNIGGTTNISTLDTADDDYDDDSLVGQIREVGDELKEVGGELLSAFGLSSNPFKKKGTQKSPTIENITAKCRCCSAPLSGKRGQSIKCSYCDTEQVL